MLVIPSWSERSHPQERLDRAAFVHGGVRLGDPIEVGLVVEHAPGIDAAFDELKEES
jgi:hypothetical protein